MQIIILYMLRLLALFKLHTIRHVHNSTRETITIMNSKLFLFACDKCYVCVCVCVCVCVFECLCVFAMWLYFNRSSPCPYLSELITGYATSLHCTHNHSLVHRLHTCTGNEFTANSTFNHSYCIPIWPRSTV